MRTFFVSGHVDLSEEQFTAHYTKPLTAAMAERAAFVVGDSQGADIMAQRYIAARSSAAEVTVYHLGSTPECVEESSAVSTRGGFATHDDKDAAMTGASDVDIAWVRSPEEQLALYGENYVTGTEKNILRREAAQAAARLQSNHDEKTAIK